jgi:hypothetical protein
LSRATLQILSFLRYPAVFSVPSSRKKVMVSGRRYLSAYGGDPDQRARAE